MEQDLNYWGIICVPIGVLVCFGTALIAWLRLELSSPSDSEKRRR